jgi:hypothetical protein
VSVGRRRLLQVFADGLADERFDLGRRHCHVIGLVGGDLRP